MKVRVEEGKGDFISDVVCLPKYPFQVMGPALLEMDECLLAHGKWLVTLYFALLACIALALPIELSFSQYETFHTFTL